MVTGWISLRALLAAVGRGVGFLGEELEGRDEVGGGTTDESEGGSCGGREFAVGAVEVR
jgi:hypothetical protein